MIAQPQTIVLYAGTDFAGIAYQERNVQGPDLPRPRRSLARSPSALRGPASPLPAVISESRIRTSLRASSGAILRRFARASIALSCWPSSRYCSMSSGNRSICLGSQVEQASRHGSSAPGQEASVRHAASPRLAKGSDCPARHSAPCSGHVHGHRSRRRRDPGCLRDRGRASLNRSSTSFHTQS
jgi:hypothetical protein